MNVDSPLARACEALPLFPLPNAVLLLGPALPLHVFEPRYRQLVQDVLTDGFLAIPQMLPAAEAGLLPPMLPYAGIGKILAHRQLDDGRYNILVQPVGRVRLVEELIGAPHPYRVGRMDLLEDTPHVPRELERSGARLLALVGPILAGMGERAVEIRRGLAEMERTRVPEAIAPFVLRDTEERQAYLAEDDPVARALLVESAVLAVMARMGAGQGEA